MTGSSAGTIGILAGVLTLTGFVPYIWTILFGGTRPNRATWFIWMILGVILATSYEASGADVSVWMARVDALGYGFIFALSLFRGQGGWSPVERLCLLSAGVGVLLWGLTGEPRIALYATLIIDFAGWLPTFLKTLAAPGSEDLSSWVLWTAGAFLNVGAVVVAGQSDTAIIAYPVYFMVVNGIIALLALVQRATQKRVATS